MGRELELRTRRGFIESVVALGSSVAVAGFAAGHEETKKRGTVNEFCCFEKPLQWMSFDQLADTLAELAALNAEIGIQGVYQNHSGRDFFGAPVWDLHSALPGIDPDHLGVVFDIRRATVEDGYCWPLHFNLVRPHLGII